MLMDEKEAAYYKGWEEHRQFFKNEIKRKEKEMLAKNTDESGPMIAECKPELHICHAVYEEGVMICKTCDLKWDHWNRTPDDCKAAKGNKRVIKDLGCKAYEKENGFTECKHCEAKFLSEMQRPPQCIALQKLWPTQKADHEQEEEPKQKMTDGEIVAAIMQEMAATFKERNSTYGSNYLAVPKLVAALFPEGVPPELIMSNQWHLFELILVKLSRFAISRLTHVDSIHDMAVYSAMIEMILTREERQK